MHEEMLLAMRLNTIALMAATLAGTLGANDSFQQSECARKAAALYKAVEDHEYAPSPQEPAP